MAHAQKTAFVFWLNGRVHLNQRGASVQSTTGSRGVRISGRNAGYSMFRSSVKGTGYPLHSPVSPSLPLPCGTVCHHISTRLYQLGFQWQIFMKFWYLNIYIYFKYVEKIQVVLKSETNSGYFIWRPIYIFDHTLSVLLRTWKFSDKVVEKTKIHILYSATFFPWKSCRLWYRMGNYVTAMHTTDENTAHAYFMMDT